MLTLFQTTNFRLFQTGKSLQTTIFGFMKMGGKFSQWVENTVGKGEIAPFPTEFSKDLYCRHIKTRACLGKG